MTMGWHMVMAFQPSLIGCYIWNANHSFELIRQSRECVINIPTVALAKKVVDIGNTSGRDVDKFKTFGLRTEQGVHVKAPLIAECFANYECKLIDATLIKNAPVRLRGGGGTRRLSAETSKERCTIAVTASSCCRG
jgi:flavin reductase (DIM6/NTAB) family NADH-FMN oxidoreductase RutF